jgi:hypothetical protein
MGLPASKLALGALKAVPCVLGEDNPRAPRKPTIVLKSSIADEAAISHQTPTNYLWVAPNSVLEEN